MRFITPTAHTGPLRTNPRCGRRSGTAPIPPGSVPASALDRVREPPSLASKQEGGFAHVQEAVTEVRIPATDRLPQRRANRLCVTLFPQTGGPMFSLTTFNKSPCTNVWWLSASERVLSLKAAALFVLSHREMPWSGATAVYKCALRGLHRSSAKKSKDGPALRTVSTTGARVEGQVARGQGGVSNSV